LKNVLNRLFPKEQKAYELLLIGETKLSIYFNNICQESCDNYSECTDGIKNVDFLENLIQQYLTPALKICPYLQLPYIIRSKAFAELCLFESAVLDARQGNILNPKNMRGIVAEKLVWWRSEMFESKLHILAKCALSALEESDFSSKSLEKIGMSKSVIEAAAKLRTEFENMDSLQNDQLDNYVNFSTLPLSYQKCVENNYNLKLKNYGLVENDVECSICLNTLLNPVTCPCGHTWCRNCLNNAIKISENCPLCRTSLPAHTFLLKAPLDKSLCELLKNAFDISYSETPLHETNLIKKGIPLFICSLIFPYSEPGYHMFEPKYRVFICLS
jgi:hypothetical protein